MATKDIRSKEQRDWDKEVKNHIEAIGKVAGWAEKYENWGERNKDWHTERECGRVRHHLELAVLELYDLQYIKEENEVQTYRERQYTDRKSRRRSR